MTAVFFPGVSAPAIFPQEKSYEILREIPEGALRDAATRKLAGIPVMKDEKLDLPSASEHPFPEWQAPSNAAEYVAHGIGHILVRCCYECDSPEPGPHDDECSWSRMKDERERPALGDPDFLADLDLLSTMYHSMEGQRNEAVAGNIRLMEEVARLREEMFYIEYEAKACLNTSPNLGEWRESMKNIHRVTQGSLDAQERKAVRALTNPEVMGGAAVFPGTRITVKRVGELAARGISLAEIQEDYPSVTAADFEFAKRHFAEAEAGDYSEKG